MNTRKFRLTLAIWITGLVAIFALSQAVLSYNPHAKTSPTGKEFVFPRAVVDLAVQENADLTVQETTTYELGEAWHGLYRDIPVAEGVSAKDISVTEISNGEERAFQPGGSTELGLDDKNGFFGTEFANNRLRIVWHIRVEDTTKTYRVRYTLVGAVKNSADASWLIFTPWGDGWASGVKTLDVNLQYPGSTYVSARAGDYQTRATKPVETDSGWTFSVNDLPGESAVQIYARSGPIAGADTNSDTSLSDVKADEKKIEKYYTDQADSEKTAEFFKSDVLWIGLVILFTLPALLILGLIYRAAGKEDMFSPGGQITDPPRPVEPAIVGKILGTKTQHLLVSTLLGLVTKRYIRTLPASSKGKVDLALTYPVGQQSFAKAPTAYENTVLDLIDKAIQESGEGSVAMGDLTWSDNDWAHAQFKAYEDELEMASEAESQIVPPNRRLALRGIMGFLTLGGLGLFLMITIAAGTSPLVSSKGWILVGTVFVLANLWTWLVALVNGDLFWRYKVANSEYMQWQEYKNYFNGLANMDNEQPASIEIWEQLLCYAAAFNKADMVLKHIPMPQGAYQSQFVHNDTLLVSSMIAPSFYSNVQSQYSSDHSSSSSGGGGFSGGGSGGGGGGGW